MSTDKLSRPIREGRVRKENEQNKVVFIGAEDYLSVFCVRNANLSRTNDTFLDSRIAPAKQTAFVVLLRSW